MQSMTVRGVLWMLLLMEVFGLKLNFYNLVVLQALYDFEEATGATVHDVSGVGTPLDLYNRPANLFVAGFIGSPRMNFIERDVVGVADDRPCRHPAAFRQRASCACCPNLCPWPFFCRLAFLF